MSYISYGNFQGTPYDGFRNPPPDIIHGLYEWLLKKRDLMTLLGHNPGARPDDPLMFEHVLEFAIEGEQTNALVLKYAGGWGSPNPQNKMKFPRIALEFWCDPIRDEQNFEVMEYDTIRRLVYIYEQFDMYMHRDAELEDVISPDPNRMGRIEWWGTVRTIDCVRLGEFSYAREKDGDGLYKGVVYYGVSCG